MTDTTIEAGTPLATSLKEARRAEKRLIADADRAERRLAKAVKRREEARARLEAIEARVEKARRRLERREREADERLAEVTVAHERRAIGPERTAAEGEGDQAALDAADPPAAMSSLEPAETPKPRRSTRRQPDQTGQDPPPAGA